MAINVILGEIKENNKGTKMKIIARRSKAKER